VKASLVVLNSFVNFFNLFAAMLYSSLDSWYISPSENLHASSPLEPAGAMDPKGQGVHLEALPSE
jgi:hypothetical protein